MGLNKNRTAFRGRSAQRAFSKGTSCGRSISGVCRALLCVFCAVKLILQMADENIPSHRKPHNASEILRKCFNNYYLWS